MKSIRGIFTLLTVLALALGLGLGSSTSAMAAAETVTSSQADDFNLYQPPSGGGGAVVVVSYEAVAVNTTADVIQMVKVPKDSTVYDVILITDDLDSGTSLTLDVGYGTNDDYFIAASTVGQAGGIVRASAATAFPLALTSSDTIDVKVKAVGTTMTGTVTLVVMYVYTP